MEKIVYFVHCVDTEGPLYESLQATFKRLYEIFGISIEPTYENLKKLQNKEIALNINYEAIDNIISPKRLNFKDTWIKIDTMLEEVMSEQFRNDLLDSFGNGWIFNWFCMDHVGFTGENPRSRDLGHHKIYDHYMKLKNLGQDIIQWHFHPLAIIKDAHRAGTTYLNSPIIFEILARKIIDRLWFPAAYRPGFHTERPDSHWFLEQWIPFDYANQSTKQNLKDQPDQSNGRFGDWREASKEWKIYHPDHDNYQEEGNCRRWIARCLNIESRIGEITLDDFREGFKRADAGKPTIISFSNHDYRDMKSEVNKIRNMIKNVSKEYPNVKFKFSNAIEAMRSVIGIKALIKPDFELEIENKSKNVDILKIESKNDIFGPQPFLAIKTKNNEYYWENLDFQGKNKWSYTFDFNTLYLDGVDKLGIATNTNSGITEIAVVNVSDNKIMRKVLNFE